MPLFVSTGWHLVGNTAATIKINFILQTNNINVNMSILLKTFFFSPVFNFVRVFEYQLIFSAICKPPKR